MADETKPKVVDVSTAIKVLERYGIRISKERLRQLLQSGKITGKQLGGSGNNWHVNYDSLLAYAGEGG